MHSSRFPALTSLSGSFVWRPASFVLGMIKGSCLASVDIGGFWDISMISLLDFSMQPTLYGQRIYRMNPTWGRAGPYTSQFSLLKESCLLASSHLPLGADLGMPWCRLPRKRLSSRHYSFTALLSVTRFMSFPYG